MQVAVDTDFFTFEVMGILLSILKIMGRLPAGFIYSLAALARFIGFGLFQYRGHVIRNQIQKSFPEKRDSEWKSIEERFQKYFSATLFETLFLLSKPLSFFQKRVQFKGVESLQNDLNRKSTLIVCGHFGNWEWGVLIAQLAHIPQPVYAVYHPLKNPKVDTFIRRSRERFGVHLIPMNQVARKMVEHQNNPALFLLIADQCPASVVGAIWLPFLNQDTPFLNGPEKLAGKFQLPVHYGSCNRIKQGYYCYTLSPLESPNITAQFAEHLEQDIRNNPASWLWSHRRWKRSRP